MPFPIDLGLTGVICICQQTIIVDSLISHKWHITMQINKCYTGRNISILSYNLTGINVYRSFCVIKFSAMMSVVTEKEKKKKKRLWHIFFSLWTLEIPIPNNSISNLKFVLLMPITISFCNCIISKKYNFLTFKWRNRKTKKTLEAYLKFFLILFNYSHMI